MKRTQIYLTDEEWRNLNLFSRRKNVSVAKLIRDAIDLMYLKKKGMNFLEALDSISGLWKDRNDLGKTEEYVRKARKDTRKKFGPS